MGTPLLGVQQEVEVHLTGQISQPRLQLVDATGNRVSDTGVLERTAEGVYRTSLRSRQVEFEVWLRNLSCKVDFHFLLHPEERRPHPWRMTFFVRSAATLEKATPFSAVSYLQGRQHEQPLAGEMNSPLARFRMINPQDSASLQIDTKRTVRFR